jgi:hypothetical protein
MTITLETVRTKKQKKDFVHLPFEIYRNNPYWVPPLKLDEMKAFDPDSNPALRFCEAEYWVAYRNQRPVGRIVAIINHKYNEKVGKKLGRFSKLEFVDDKEVFETLMKKALGWLKEKGMDTVHGPLGFTNLDNQGLLIEGFDYLPSVASVYHHPYYRKYLEDYGFRKEIDWVEFRLTIGQRAVEKSNRGAAMLKKRYGFEVLHFKHNRDLMPYAEPLFALVNEAFTSLPFVVPFDNEMVKMYSRKYFKVVNPKYVFFVKKGEEIVGFMMGVPSLSEAFQKARGKLFPFGFYHIKKAMNHPKVIDFYLAGIKPKYEHTGAAVILYAEIQNQMLRDGLHTVETTGEFETNKHAISNWKNFDHIQHKRRRCFIREIE